MHRLTCLGLLALVAAVPMTFAHSPAGTPKNYCEPVVEWNLHDFAVGRSDVLVFYGYDGNLADCNNDTVPYDFDGHQEWAYGGGWLLASENLQTPEQDGATNCFGAIAHHPVFPTVYVSEATTGNGIAFQVGIDWPMGGGDPDPSTPYACGDGIVDPCNPLDPLEIDDQTCEANDRLLAGVGSLSLTGFLPGQDGSYIVFVDNAAGHFWT